MPSNKHSKMHLGLFISLEDRYKDFPIPIGTPVYAVLPGIVTRPPSNPPGPIFLERKTVTTNYTTEKKSYLNDEQKGRAEALDRAAAAIRGRTVISGAQVHPVAVITVADWILGQDFDVKTLDEVTDIVDPYPTEPAEPEMPEGPVFNESEMSIDEVMAARSEMTKSEEPEPEDNSDVWNLLEQGAASKRSDYTLVDDEDDG